MATSAMAQETLRALRREIAKIEGVLPETLAAPEAKTETEGKARDAISSSPSPFCLASGSPAFDRALDGGIPAAALTEILGAQTRDAAAVAGFALAMAARAMPAPQEAGKAPCHGASQDAPLLWIGPADMFAEAGFPYMPGLAQLFGLPASHLLFSHAPRVEDTLWIAEEAASSRAFAVIVLELYGNPKRLDLKATRRLHRRAAAARRPLFLLRQGAQPEPTAAPVRLLVSPAPSARRRTFSGFLPQSIGPPAFSVTIDKSRGRPAAPFRLEWNRHDLAFQESRPEDIGALVPVSGLGPRPAPTPREDVALQRPQRRTG